MFHPRTQEASVNNIGVVMNDLKEVEPTPSMLVTPHTDNKDDELLSLTSYGDIDNIFEIDTSSSIIPSINNSSTVVPGHVTLNNNNSHPNMQSINPLMQM